MGENRVLTVVLNTGIDMNAIPSAGNSAANTAPCWIGARWQ